MHVLTFILNLYIDLCDTLPSTLESTKYISFINSTAILLVIQNKIIEISRYSKAEADIDYSAYHEVDGVNVSCKPIQVKNSAFHVHIFSLNHL